MYITKQFNCTSALRLVRERSEFFVAKLWEYGARNLFMRFEQSGSFGMAFDINNSLHLPLRTTIIKRYEKSYRTPRADK